ncbi:MAG: GNAT family N-acetyltransferase [Anaerolineae bacterium]|nr:GNAT family N-acetyltransferase [Anaerolineae bacterium]
MIRHITADDVTELAAVAARAGNFSQEETKTVGEMAVESLGPNPSGYRFLCYVAEGRIAGFACYGHISLTESAYDLYWLGVDAGQHGRGIGGKLLAEVERGVAAEGGRLLVAETSGTEAYAAARTFYLRQGFYEAGRIEDFYGAADAKVIYVKRVAATS